MGMRLTIYRATPETIERLRGDDESVIAWLEEVDSGRVDLDNAWDALGRLVAGGDAAGFFAFSSGPLHEEDLGYGPALEIPLAGVIGLQEALRGVDTASIGRYLGSPEFQKEPPYPFHFGLSASEIDDEVQWLTGVANELRAFVDGAAEAGDHLVCVMS